MSDTKSHSLFLCKGESGNVQPTPLGWSLVSDQPRTLAELYVLPFIKLRVEILITVGYGDIDQKELGRMLCMFYMSYGLPSDVSVLHSYCCQWHNGDIANKRDVVTGATLSLFLFDVYITYALLWSAQTHYFDSLPGEHKGWMHSPQSNQNSP